MKFIVVSMKSIVKILSLALTHFKKLVSVLQYTPVTLKVVLKAACDPEIVPKVSHECYGTCSVRWRKLTKESEGKPVQKFYAFLRIFIISVFMHASRSFIPIYFYYRQGRLKNYFCMYRSKKIRYRFNFMGLQNISTW
jgi:hypothetical protein